MRTDFRTTGKVIERTIEGSLEIEIRENALTGVVTNWYIVRNNCGEIISRTTEYGEAYNRFVELIHSGGKDESSNI